MVIAGVITVSHAVYFSSSVAAVASAFFTAPLLYCGMLMVLLNAGQRRILLEHLNRVAHLRVFAAMRLVFLTMLALLFLN